jgi:glucosylceramidase
MMRRARICAFEGASMAKSSRRGFLKAATGTAAALTLSRTIPVLADASGQVKVWSTYRDRRHAQGESVAWKAAGQVAAEAIALDPTATRQEVLGFGAAMTDASCYLLSQLTASMTAPSPTRN